MKKLNRGAVLLDKPPGMTSRQAVDRVKSALGVKRAGHAGTLDPNVSGLLLIALGEARKAMPLLLGLPKEYEGVMHLHRDTEIKKIKEVCQGFVGRITQIPPKRAAVARLPRQREIFKLEILRAVDRDVQFRVSCQAGTYIKKLVHDIGQRLGGASLTKLRRTAIGPFSVRESVSLVDLSPKRIIALERALERTGLKKVILKSFAIPKIQSGAPLLAGWAARADPGIKKGNFIGLFDKKKIIALGIARQDCTKWRSGAVARTDRIFKEE